MAINLLDLNARGLVDFFSEIDEKPFRARQLLKWMHHFGQNDFSRMSDLSKPLREKLKFRALIEAPEVIREHVAADGTRKWLFSMGSANAVETVFIPEEKRGTLCISSQVGCALECAFCATGKQGFNRNLSVAEIIGQLWHANRMLGREPGSDRIISNIVMMGMGEPLLNFDNVVTALDLMLDDFAYGLSRRRVTVSTSGIVPAMDRLKEVMPVSLAVSLHAPNDSLRDVLVPVNKKYPLAELMAACRRYLVKAPRDYITFEYVMIGGVNDAPSQARELLDLVRDVPCKFNLIPFNPFDSSAFSRSKNESIAAFREILMEGGVVTTIRKTRGDEIDAACGQLAGMVLDRTKRRAG